MDPDVGEFAQVTAVVGAFAGFCCFLFISVRVTLARLGQPRDRRITELPAIDDARFARLEQAVDAIAVEVERISEAQRFTTKLLAERVSDGDASTAGVAQAGRGGPLR